MDERYWSRVEIEEEIPSFYRWKNSELNSWSGNADIYSEEDDSEEDDSELEKLRLQKKILELQLEMQQNQTWDSNEIENANIDFEIRGWYMKNKAYSLRFKSWLKIDKEKVIKRERILYSRISTSDEWYNRYNIELNTQDGKNIIIPIEYDWWRIIHILDNNWRIIQTTEIQIESNNYESHEPSYSRRNDRNYDRNNNGFIEIKTHNWEIVLFLDLWRKRHNHNRRRTR